MPGKCHASNIMHKYPVEFIMDEKPLYPLFSVCMYVYGGRGWGRGGTVVTNDWYIIRRNKNEIFYKVFVVFISFISPILRINEANHNRLVISAAPSISHPTNGKGTYCFGANPNDRHRS